MGIIEIEGSSFIVVKCDEREICVSQAFNTFDDAWEAMHQDWLECHDREDPDADEGECNPGEFSAWLNRAHEDRDADWAICEIALKGA